MWIGMKEIRWRSNKMRMRSWRRFWNEDKWMDVPCKRKKCKRYRSWWHIERMSQDKKVKGLEEKKK